MSQFRRRHLNLSRLVFMTVPDRSMLILLSGADPKAEASTETQGYTEDDET